MKGVREKETTTTVQVEGRLLMADFSGNTHRCRIHPAEGPPVQCTFDEGLRHEVLRAMTKQVRVTGEAKARNGGLGRVRIANIRVLERAPKGEEAEAEPDFWEEPTLEELIERQGVKPVEDINDLRSNFWPEEESADDFIAWRERCRAERRGRRREL